MCQAVYPAQDGCGEVIEATHGNSSRSRNGLLIHHLERGHRYGHSGLTQASQTDARSNHAARTARQLQQVDGAVERPAQCACTIAPDTVVIAPTAVAVSVSRPGRRGRRCRLQTPRRSSSRRCSQGSRRPVRAGRGGEYRSAGRAGRSGRRVVPTWVFLGLMSALFTASMCSDESRGIGLAALLTLLKRISNAALT